VRPLSPSAPPHRTVGIRRRSDTVTLCAVLMDSWPGWLAALPSHSFMCSHLFTPDPFAPWLPPLLAAHAGCQVHPFPPTELPSGITFFLGQGSMAVMQVLRKCRDSTWVFSFDRSLRVVSTTTSIALYHPDYGGGVTNGTWQFWSSILDFRAPPTPEVNGRTLFHDVDRASKVDRYTPSAPPAYDAQGAAHWIEATPEVSWTDAGHTILDVRGLLPIDNVQCLVQCPIVYSPTRWGIRKLTVKELLSVFDLSEALLSSMSGATSCVFQDSAPGRLLGAVLGSIVHANRPELRSLALGSPPSRELGEPRGTTASAWPETPGTEWAGVSESTTKADDAQAHTALWDRRIDERLAPDAQRIASFQQHFGRSPLESIRDFFLRIWRRRVLQSLLRYLSESKGSAGMPRDIEVGRDAVHKATQATWWEWAGGSTPFFWRWPPQARVLVRDGHTPWFVSEPPRCVKPQRPERNEDVRSKMEAKINSVLAKGYIAQGEVCSLTAYFSVPKGSDDIRMVYDATASGLNACLWAPNFWLPSAEGLVDRMDSTSWMGDLDMGEQFLNFPLHLDLQKFCGID